MSNDYFFIKRCLSLAALGSGNVAPNPMVGAVLVYNNKIIGEGYHEKFGEAHAEVNCINNVKEGDKHLIAKSVMYVSLEPCSHFGKTPPCADLIIFHGIKKVVIGCIDTFAKVNGGGIEKLKNAGIEVVLGNWQKECNLFNKRFFTFHESKRPYIILKWAQSANGKIAAKNQANQGERVLISNDISNRLVHKWRSEEAAIMIGTCTAFLDNPTLTNRYYPGKNPKRIIIDKDLNLPPELHVFNTSSETYIFNQHSDEKKNNLHYIKISFDENILPQIMEECFKHQIQSILVEGGSVLLQSFINQHLWDECRIIANKNLIIENGLSAPNLKDAVETDSFYLLHDRVDFYKPSLLISDRN